MIQRAVKKVLRDLRIKHDPIRYARSIGVEVGENCKLVAIDGGTFGTEPYLIKLGNHVEFSFNVTCITHDGGMWVARDVYPSLDLFGTIEIGDNVFVGAGAILLPGTIIEDNCVIGAGSVVRGRIPEGSVAAGVPARVIKPVQEYIAKGLEKGLMSKMLSPSQKEKVVRGHFKVFFGS